MHQEEVREHFYSDIDFKVAIQFLHKSNNSIANHTAIQQWATTYYVEVLGDRSNIFIEPAWKCKPDYFKDATNPVTL